MTAITQEASAGDAGDAGVSVDVGGAGDPKHIRMQFHRSDSAIKLYQANNMLYANQRATLNPSIAH